MSKLDDLLKAKQAKLETQPKPTIQPKAAPRSLAQIIADKQAAQEAAMLAQTAPAPAQTVSFKDKFAIAQALPNELAEGTVDATTEARASYHGAFSLDITLNERQLEAKDMALAGKSFALIGAAGTGKTTTQRAVAEQLLKDSRLKETDFKLVGGTPGQRVSAPSIAFVAYTRRATANLERAIHKLPELEEQLRFNCLTVHGLLEFQPVFYYDEEKGKDTMRFVPTKDAMNPLTITHLVVEESSMLGLDLWDKLYDALPEGMQIIFIGDINQLPPFGGTSILNYALTQLPVVELNTVYRQAEESGIIANAHRILKGQSLVETPDFRILDLNAKAGKQLSQATQARKIAKAMQTLYERGSYDPEQDIILSPFNKQELGTIALNKWIAQFLGDRREAEVYEVIAGFNKHYVAVGDRVMYDKQDCEIIDIRHNGSYMGQAPQPPSQHLNRFGINGHGHDAEDLDAEALSYENFRVDALLESAVDERKQAASHILTLRRLDDNQELTLESAGDFTEAMFSLGYALTVHKAQGCEWRTVYFVFHKAHATMRYRELLYTAVTRAREKFIAFSEPWIMDAAIQNPRIKGNTLADKIEYFNANLDLSANVCCTK